MSKNKKRNENGVYTVQIPIEKEKEFKIYVNSIKGRFLYDKKAKNSDYNSLLEEESEMNNSETIDTNKSEAKEKSFIHMFENDEALTSEEVNNEEIVEEISKEIDIHELKQDVKPNENEITLETETKPHWIHDTEEDPAYSNGVKILRSCVCSECRYHANAEKEICPKCNNKMH